MSSNKQLVTDYTNSYYFGLNKQDKWLYSRSAKDINFKNLFNLIISKKNFLRAIHKLKNNTGKNTPGTDGITMKEILKKDLDEYYQHIKNRLDYYEPNDTRRVYIPKASGKKRPLGIACIEDRIIQQMIVQILEPICEARFEEESYGFRPTRGCHQALARVVQKTMHQECKFTVDVDIKGFFDNVNHRVLMNQLWNFGIRDEKVLMIIKAILKGTIDGKKMTKGVPQCGVLSPLLANVYLDRLDKWINNQWEYSDVLNNYNSKNKSTNIRNMKKMLRKKGSDMKEGYLVRYADDFKILCKSYWEAKRFYHGVKNFFEKDLKLEISERKSKIVNLTSNNSKFLGFDIKLLPYKQESNNPLHRNYMTRIKISDKALENIREKVKYHIDRIAKFQNDKEIYKYNVYVNGIHNYYSAANDVCSQLYKLHDELWSRIKGLKDKVKYGRDYKVERQLVSALKGKDKVKYFYIRPENPMIPIYRVNQKRLIQRKPNINVYDEKDLKKLGFRNNVYTKRCSSWILKVMKKNIKFNNLIYSYLPGLYIQQKGKTKITNENIQSGNFEIHHKLPKEFDGTDEYHNLIIVSKLEHRLIHGNKPTVTKIVKKIGLGRRKFNRLNKLRLKAQREKLSRKYCGVK